MTDIQSKLYGDDSTRAANIKVDVQNGIVTLSGDVPSSDVELEAMKVANGTSGVRSVNDQMKVNAAAAATQPAPDQLASSQPGATATPKPSPSASAPPAGSYPPTSTPESASPTMPAPAPVSSPIASAPRSSAPPPERARPRDATLTVPAGERLQVRMIDGVDSRTNSPGQTFRASLDAPLVSGNRVVVQAGSPVTVALVDSSSAGRIKGRSSLEVRVVDLTAGGRSYPVSTNVYDETGKAKGKQSAVRTGIGAAAGALIGGLAGGGKGAAIGAGAGGGAGLGYQLFTHGSQVKIPSESVLTFRLSAPLTIPR
ncbi:MAG: BON domain-containing protein [Acidobacteriota bacterium]|nr:BON domain-containing protein [Acidobacteriota bacterium]